MSVCPPAQRCPVEIAAGGLDQPGDEEFAVCTPAQGAEAVQRRQLATQGDSKDGPIPVCPPAIRCSVEISVGGLDEPRLRVSSVRAPALGTETI
jgi:hypothetical protein